MPSRCILSKFYIKPQHGSVLYQEGGVVSYRNSTSNHNCTGCHSTPESLYLIEILHQTTTRTVISCLIFSLYLIEILHQTTTPACCRRSRPCCILSKFYIKPQLLADLFDFILVVSYRNSTSNHNTSLSSLTMQLVVSYRNSTSNHNYVPYMKFPCQLYLIEILHQTTTSLMDFWYRLCCILSKFYIKPQLASQSNWPILVVSYRNSTSNHNCITSESIVTTVVSYRNSTSNHNTLDILNRKTTVVSYRNSTSNHNVGPHID